MNWKLRIDYFQPLEEGDLALFAPPGEVYRAAQSYNTALACYVEGKEQEAKQRLEQIAEDYPLFPQASHLLGIILAAEGNFEGAEHYLERVRLLNLAAEEREQLAVEYRLVRQEAQALRRARAKRKHRERLLTPIKKEIAKESILQRVPAVDSGDSVEYRSSYVYEDTQEKRKTALSIIVAISVVCLILLLFIFLWRPAILKEQTRRQEQLEKLEWLETELAARAGDAYEIAKLLEEYQNWLESGRPLPVASTVSEVTETTIP